jgi:hypothetical protein
MPELKRLCGESLATPTDAAETTLATQIAA